MPLSELELKIASGRATLKLLSKDLNQIVNTGAKAKQGRDEFITAFNSMYPSLLSFRTDYFTKYEELLTLAIMEGKSDLFPTDDDQKNRLDVNSLYYKGVEYFQLLGAGISKPSGSGVGDKNTAGNVSILEQSLARSRLPKIDLPTFAGNISEWPIFKQLFSSIIHNNSEIPTLEKFYYLCSALSGDPQSHISAFTLTEENYPKAWDALLKRYDNKRLLATSYVDKILDFVPSKGPPTIASLDAFMRTIVENVSAFKSLSIKDPDSFLWLALALKKLDIGTRQQFETFAVKSDWPTFDQLVEFLQGKRKVLQLTEPTTTSPTSWSSNLSKSKARSHILAATQSSIQPSSKRNCICPCNSQHPLFLCSAFKNKPVSERRNFLKGKQICFNCLRVGHLATSCSSVNRCRMCSSKHHTLLHYQQGQDSPDSPFSQLSSQRPSPPCQQIERGSGSDAQQTVVASVTGPAHVLLGTAEALISASNRTRQTVRILLDCGSQFSLITASCAKRLGLPWRATKHSPVGVGQTPLSTVKGQLDCTLHSRIFPEYQLSASPLVVRSITGPLPTSPLSLKLDLDLHDLADPSFEQSREIDFLLGNDLFMSIIMGKPRMLTEGFGTLPTIFGAVIMGNTGSSSSNGQSSTPQCLCLTENPISDELLRQFWSIEEVPTCSIEQLADPCEEHFVSTHTRDSTGRYVLALPFKDLPTGLEDSHHQALSRFNSLERKFSRDPISKEKYLEFMSDYETQGHMSETTTPSSYIIPHHGVLRSHHPQSKLRVVFDASLSTKNGSLNDKLHTGPKLQKDLTEVITNFRLHPVAFTCDLVKMYRQILIRPEDRRYQHILWRNNPKEAVKTYELKTVTYGVKSSPFQALRTLKQLNIDEGSAYPTASRVLEEDIYVDDIVSGAATPGDAVELRNQLIQLLQKGGFEIHKLASNSADFLQAVESKNECTLSLSPREICVTKILGMSWDPVDDVFFFQVDPPDLKAPTKRSILSAVARLFDPVGFLAPVIFQAKYILQLLWRSKVGWDDTPEPALIREWQAFSENLPTLTSIKIPRLVLTPGVDEIELIGFCDASQKGYAAVVYLHVRLKNQEPKTCLLKAKTKLAPLKTLSIPRLELCAAHLLVKLNLSISAFLKRLTITRTRYFTDSTIVLAWLSQSPHKWQTFVANRVSFIASHTQFEDWYHVSSSENPADLASRGSAPHLLENNRLWWAGPAFLKTPNLTESLVPASSITTNVNVPEQRSGVTLSVRAEKPLFISWIESHSRYLRMLRILSYILRFVDSLKGNAKYTSQLVCVEEIQRAEIFCIKAFQRYTFSEEFLWEENRPTSKRLLQLSAFLDSDRLLRVGGRLQNAHLPYSTKHPIILTGFCHFTSMIIDHLHHTHFHLGNQAINVLIRRRYWIFRLRQSIKSRLRKCLTCFRMKARPINPLMGNLPSPRVQPSRPFTHTGVDFAGPFYVKQGSRRNSPQTKSYLGIFICLATRAVHLEIVSALSTDAFLASLDRFIARRGLPHRIYSDCGTNFVGASRHLRELYQWWMKPDTRRSLDESSASRRIQWCFNPPNAPHFGGLWEAAVKSAKHHFQRVIGDRAFTFEELTTLFSRIEAILNSRPLCSMDDTSISDFLTPGHFLIGQPLLTLPEEDLSHLPLNHLSRWQLVQNSVQHFWRRWHSEYLHTLHKRPKWYQHTKPLQVGDLVLISDPSSTPLRWRTARIEKCHPGEDGVVRVVTIRDSNGVRLRPVHRLVSLSHLSESSYSQ